MTRTFISSVTGHMRRPIAKEKPSETVLDVRGEIPAWLVEACERQWQRNHRSALEQAKQSRERSQQHER